MTYLLYVPFHGDGKMEEELKSVEYVEGVPRRVGSVFTMQHTLEDLLCILIPLWNLQTEGTDDC